MTPQIYEENWYRSCVEECAAILTEKGEESKIAILELHYLIGKRVLEDALHWERAPKGEKIIENLAQDIFLNIQNKQSAARRLWECVRFAKKFPDLCAIGQNSIDVMKLPNVEGTRTPGWTHIRGLLSNENPCAHEWQEKEVVEFRCTRCGKKKS